MTQQLYLYKLSCRNSHTYAPKYLYFAGLPIIVKDQNHLWVYNRERNMSWYIYVRNFKIWCLNMESSQKCLKKYKIYRVWFPDDTKNVTRISWVRACKNTRVWKEHHCQQFSVTERRAVVREWEKGTCTFYSKQYRIKDWTFRKLSANEGFANTHPQTVFLTHTHTLTQKQLSILVNMQSFCATDYTQRRWLF